MSIATIEDSLLALIKNDPLRKKLNRLDVLPGPLTSELLKKLSLKSPGVYLFFSGYREKGQSFDVAKIDGTWIFYVITAHASGREARRRGSNKEIGAYEIIERLTPLLHGHRVVDEGTMSVKDCRNLFNGELDKRGVALYAITCSLPMAMGYEADTSLLDDFVTFHADYDIPPHEADGEHEKWQQEPPDFTTSAPDAQDTQTDLDK